jgi:hypothetical protein
MFSVEHCAVVVCFLKKLKTFERNGHLGEMFSFHDDFEIAVKNNKLVLLVFCKRSCIFSYF